MCPASTATSEPAPIAHGRQSDGADRSPSTEGYDRGEKLSHYKDIDTLQEVLLIAHDERRVDLWRRVGTHWTQLTFHSGDMLDLASLECALAVDDIYHNPPDR